MNSDRAQAIARRVVELAAEEAGIDPATVSPASHFVDDLRYDSLSTVEFAMALEEEFEISIPDDDLPSLRTVADVIEYVQKRVPTAAATRP